MLGPDELTAAGRGYSPGDRVIGCRNDRKLGILNGQRGTVTATHPAEHRIEVRLDDGAAVSLGGEYLADGHLDHAYAITAHRAQGATVDRSFVLGSEELYREWGYTALSRHRQDARFYVAGGDLKTDPELPPHHDPLLYGITSLLERTQAKGLAIDELTTADRTDLEQQRRELRDQFTREQPPRRLRHEEDHKLDVLSQEVARADRHQERLLEQRQKLGWRGRRERDRIDQELEHNAERRSDVSARLDRVRSTVLAAGTTDQTWVDTHGPDAHRLLAVDHELRTRDATQARIDQQLETHHRDPLLDRALDRELGMDLGL